MTNVKLWRDSTKVDSMKLRYRYDWEAEEWNPLLPVDGFYRRGYRDPRYYRTVTAVEDTGIRKFFRKLVGKA